MHQVAAAERKIINLINSEFYCVPCTGLYRSGGNLATACPKSRSPHRLCWGSRHGALTVSIWLTFQKRNWQTKKTREVLRPSGMCSPSSIDWLIACLIQLRFSANVNSRSSSLHAVTRPSVVCNVGAPYSADPNFRQCFYTIWYHGYPLTSTENFTKIVPAEPLRRGS